MAVMNSTEAKLEYYEKKCAELRRENERLEHANDHLTAKLCRAGYCDRG